MSSFLTVNLRPATPEELSNSAWPDDDPSIKRMVAEVEGAHLWFEMNDHVIWVIDTATEEVFRNQGRGKYLVRWLRKYAENEGKTVEWGAFTEDGEKYLKKYTESAAARLAGILLESNFVATEDLLLDGLVRSKGAGRGAFSQFHAVFFRVPATMSAGARYRAFTTVSKELFGVPLTAWETYEIHSVVPNALELIRSQTKPTPCYEIAADGTYRKLD